MRLTTAFAIIYMAFLLVIPTRFFFLVWTGELPLAAWIGAGWHSEMIDKGLIINSLLLVMAGFWAVALATLAWLMAEGVVRLPRGVDAGLLALLLILLAVFGRKHTYCVSSEGRPTRCGNALESYGILWNAL